MDLHSGLPYWIIKNPLFDYYNPLKKDLETDIVIIGSGITGALMAVSYTHLYRLSSDLKPVPDSHTKNAQRLSP